LLGVLAARQLGAERIIAMSRYAPRQKLAIDYGATDIVTERGDEVLRIRPGDTVVCPPDADHWHGAGSDTFMSHLAMLESRPDGGDPTTWLEPVTDDQYKAANQPSSAA
jgi:threonine dehydrogenase-like Zn-dependent dehydrogenase